jgi:hypothetical protein
MSVAMSRSTTSDVGATVAGPTRPPRLVVWLITDGKAGMDTQARGVADALDGQVPGGLDIVVKHVAPRGVWAMAAPWGPVAPAERFGEPGTPFAPPWPDLAIATGRASIPYIRALKRRAGAATFTVVLQDPKTGPGTADLIWVPAHDRRRGPNVITTPTAPHSFSAARIAALRTSVPPEIAALPAPRVAVILGGKNGVYSFTTADDDRLEAALASLRTLGASFMITPSRRTHQRLIRAVDRATEGGPRLLWDGRGANPYAQFLAHADALIVTADSVNMCGEACATGRPVHVFTPSGGSPKFARFHAALADLGATRPLPDRFETPVAWSYAPVDSAAIIATAIRARWAATAPPDRAVP